MKRWKYFLVTAGVVVLDQTTKLLTKGYMMLSQSKEVLGDFLRYTYIENPGMAFGIRIGNRTLFTIFSVAASVVIFAYLLRTRGDHKLVKWSLALILGGAIGNLIDRVLYGSVVDFIDVGIGDLRWPVFNVADMAVSLGMMVLIVVILFEKKPAEDADPQGQTEPPLP